MHDQISQGQLRQQVPLLKECVYLDNSATSLTPQFVLDAQNEYYRNFCCNIDRSAYRLAQKATEVYELSRAAAAKDLLNCQPQEFIFTRNFTEAANLVAYALEHPLLDRGKSGRFSFARPLVKWKSGDNIVCTSLEHHSNFLPWLRLAKHRKISFRVANPDKCARLSVENIIRLVDKNTRLVAFQHVSNCFGVVHPVREIIAAIKEKNPAALIFIDGAQAAGHIPVDFAALGCDFYAFAGHKGPLGPKGSGGLAVKDGLLGDFNPFLIGGGSIADVTHKDYQLRDDIHRFDGGTPYVPGMIGLARAARYLACEIGFNRVREHELALARRLLEGIRRIDGIILYGPEGLESRTGIVTFNLRGWLAHDVALTLDEKWSILTRAGHHCCIPAMQRFGLLDSYGGNVRASLHYYNTAGDIDKLLEALVKLAG